MNVGPLEIGRMRIVRAQHPPAGTRRAEDRGGR
jgi:hypothetical protein